MTEHLVSDKNPYTERVTLTRVEWDTLSARILTLEEQVRWLTNALDVRLPSAHEDLSMPSPREHA